MQIFAVSRHMPDVTPQRLAGVVRQAARAFPRLDPATLTHTGSQRTGVSAAALSHGQQLAAPRRYRARRDAVSVFFDGRPIDRLGLLASHDADVLLECWSQLPGRLEGVFSAVRVDVETAEVDCLLDVLGLAQVYIARRAGGFVLSNSVEVVRLITGVGTPDSLGVSSLLTLGWAAGDHTLLSGIEVLEGGHLHRFGRAPESRPILTAATVVPRDAPPRPSAPRLAHAMTATMQAAVKDLSPIDCGLTAGRESRILLALVVAAGVPATFFTSGRPGDLDVEIARDLASRFGLPHRFGLPDLPAGDRWAGETARFVSQTDGLASLWYVTDWVEHQRPTERLGLKLWGPGGEIGRSARIGIGIPLMANAPLVRRLWRAQRYVLEQKTVGWQGLLTDAAMEETFRYLRVYLARRREEGWRAGEALESYYAFERVKHWAAAGVRRAAEGTDTFAPFVSADYIRHCYALTSAQRYMESVQYDLLSLLAPELRDLPFDHPWKPQRPRAAAANVLLEAARWVRSRARSGDASRERWSVPLTAIGSYPHRWVEAGLPAAGERCLSWEQSPLWDFVDRSRFAQLVRGDPVGRSATAEGLSRILTAFWYFHGRHAT